MNNKKILMVTMGLGIGGAETHIVELSKQLTLDGFEVICVSNGGVYVSELEKYNIRHYKLPLNNKNPMNLFTSYFGLKKIIRKENIDIIHAHARIPAFICAIISRKMHIPMCTTVHGTYYSNWILKLITNWGMKSLAVSEDIKTYLISRYNISPFNITVTVNGVDTTAFYPSAPDKALMDSLSIRSDTKKLAYLGRISSDSGKFAFELIESLEKIKSVISNIQIIIIGGGDLFPKLQIKALEANKKFGNNTVILTGPRIDIAALINVSDAVIALSRAALEAMACEKPVILAGNYGYLGLIDKSKLSACIATNFTARGYNIKSSDEFLSDCISALTLSPEKKRDLVSFSRSVVIENYSVSRMSQDAQSVYRSLPCVNCKKTYDFVLLGYYGFQNSGDDALLYSIVQNLRRIRPDISLCIMSNKARECRRILGTASIYRFNFFSAIKVFSKSKVLILGGGNLIQDITSLKSLVYYTSMLRLAQIMGLKTMLYSNGIGPVKSRFGIAAAKKALSGTDVITLREEKSFEFLKSNGIIAPQVEITADETLTLTPIDKNEIEMILSHEGIDNTKDYFCISVRPYKSYKIGFEKIIAEALDKICSEYSLIPLFIPLQRPKDMSISENISSLMHSKSIILSKAYSDLELIGIISCAKFVIGMRLHSIVYSVCAKTPAVAIVYDPKVEAFMKSAGLSEYLSVSQVTSRKIINIVKAIMSNYDERKEESSEINTRLSCLALKNGKIAIELLDSIK